MSGGYTKSSVISDYAGHLGCLISDWSVPVIQILHNIDMILLFILISIKPQILCLFLVAFGDSLWDVRHFVILIS